MQLFFSIIELLQSDNWQPASILSYFGPIIFCAFCVHWEPFNDNLDKMRWVKKGQNCFHIVIDSPILRSLFLMLFYTVRYGIFNMSQSSNTKNHLANDFFNLCGGSFFQFSRHRFALFVAESFSCFCVEVKNVTLSSFQVTLFT